MNVSINGKIVAAFTTWESEVFLWAVYEGRCLLFPTRDQGLPIRDILVRERYSQVPQKRSASVLK